MSIRSNTSQERGPDLTGTIYAAPSRPPFSIPWYFYDATEGVSVGQRSKDSARFTGNASVGTGLLGSLPSSYFPGPDGIRSSPWFETPSQGGLTSTLANSILGLIESLNANKRLDLQAPPLPAHGAIHFSHLDISRQELQVTLQIGSTRRLTSDPRLFRLYPTQGMRQLIAHTRLVAGLGLSQRS
ncbi:hypothetical protein BJ684DRAFT_21398 [Piptocephalis cylindrospora]|uniref:Uncharacterized protein n=1 Tax=Piptocephalis cylindrospora TaxID=1907219 RepID=A0A4P9XZW6_9FUNG|nr:hypothetical protein BJ684DRAFT_21398 [Piptocephalis cylindrospora]|eukprot:RKP12033.1 hypothetical protein BJ684DRAFT_21398 [Piptocephalis cylindrospora]